MRWDARLLLPPFTQNINIIHELRLCTPLSDIIIIAHGTSAYIKLCSQAHVQLYQYLQVIQLLSKFCSVYSCQVLHYN